MRKSGTAIELSASDLSQFLGCRHRTALDLAVARGLRQAPSWIDPGLIVLQQRGLVHERRYVKTLTDEGLDVFDLANRGGDDAVARSVEAIRSRTQIILQPALKNGRWFGRPDVLRRVPTPSALGEWSYEVVDTKLAKETRGGTVLQLAMYSDLLGIVQGLLPEMFHVVTPDPANPIVSGSRFPLISDLFGRGWKPRYPKNLIAAANYPEPVEHCEVCRWWSTRDKRRRQDDHLCLVAGISSLQTRELRSVGVNTLAQLGSVPLPLPFTPRRGAVDTYVRAREQARVQLEERNQNTPVYELLPVTDDHGLARLPAPSKGDVCLDIEGDPFARDGGREYLFGLLSAGVDEIPTYQALWAHDDGEERRAFEMVMEVILKCWAADPAMHVYHYAPYETAAFKRLIGRHATREADLDHMLRAGLFVDLYAVVKHALRASVEQYSIKDLERFYGFTRSIDLRDARTNLRLVESALELGTMDGIPSKARLVVQGYNRDDCASALRLREWLERLRESLELAGTLVPRPEHTDDGPSEELDARARRVRELMAGLTQNVPEDRGERSEEQQARWLLAHILDWHRREAKAPWWEFFRLRDLTEEELFGERGYFGAALRGSNWWDERSPIDRYGYPLQEYRRSGRRCPPST